MIGFISIGIATVMYIITGICCMKQGDYIHGFLWWSYSLANMCLMAWELKKYGGNIT